MKTVFKWRNYLVLYLLSIFLFNLALLRLPLTSVFGYEFSVVNSLLLVLFSGIYSIYFYNISIKEDKKSSSTELFKSLYLFLLIPFCVSLINSFIIGFCSFFEGLWFYLVITVPSILIGAALGSISVLLLKRFRTLLLILLYIGILSIIAAEIYFNPQVYIFNPIIGYFPGTIYDEGITVTGKLILYRLFNILFFGLLFIIANKQIYKREKRKVGLSGVFIVIIVVAFYWLSPKLGFSTTLSSLSSELSKTIESDHFVIQCDRRLEDIEVKMLTLNHEYYYQELKKYFNIELSDKIHSFVFYDNNQKKELFGSQNADVAKPWLNQIYITFDNWNNTLKHELAHCFSANFGAGIFKLASGFNPMLIEGIAEAADGNYDNNSLHFMAALAYNTGYSVDLSYLLTKFGFYKQPSVIAYIFSGSFIQYLIDVSGIEKFKEFYTTGKYTTTYGVELNESLKDYYLFLTKLQYTFTEDQGHYYFGRKSLFQKICPRTISNSLQAGWEQMSYFDFDEARNTFESILTKSDSYSALVGIARSYEEEGNILNAINVINNYIDSYKNTSYYYNLELILADLNAKVTNLKTADSIYSVLIGQYPNKRLYYIAKTRGALIEQSKIDEYLKGSDYDKYEILLQLNKANYNYSTFPILITLSESLNESYGIFKDKLSKKIVVDDPVSSYAAFLLSEFMLDNYDFTNARKLAGLSLRYSADENFNIVKKQQFNKAEWFYQNANRLLESMRIVK